MELRLKGVVMEGHELRRVRCVTSIFAGIQQTMAVDQTLLPSYYGDGESVRCPVQNH